VNLWQVTRQTQVNIGGARKVHKAPVTSLTFLNNEQTCASASVEGLVVLWDLSTNKDKKAFTILQEFRIPQIGKQKRGAELAAISLKYNTRLDELIALGTDKRLTFWSVSKRKMITQLQADFEADLTSIAISPDG
jgi:WD40 repeat protein